MALPYQVTFSIQDGEGKIGTGVFYIKSNQTAANAVSEAQGLLQKIADMSIGALIRADVSVPLDVSGLTNNTASGASNRDYRLRMILASAEGHETVLTIPAGDISEVLPNTNAVDQGVGTPGKALADDVIVRPLTTSHDEDVTAVVKFYEVHGR